MKIPGGHTLSTLLREARVDMNCTAVMPLYAKVIFSLDSGALSDDDDASTITAAVRYKPHNTSLSGLWTPKMSVGAAKHFRGEFTLLRLRPQHHGYEAPAPGAALLRLLVLFLPSLQRLKCLRVTREARIAVVGPGPAHHWCGRRRGA